MELDKILVKKAQEMIGNAKRIVILTHMAPDGDAMGSSLALWHAVRNSEFRIQNSDQVTVIVPNAFPAFFNWMPGASEILVYEKEQQRCNQLLAEADLFLCTDFNEPKRIGAVGEKMLLNPAPKILWDHHILSIQNSYPKGTIVSDVRSQTWYDVLFSFPEACSSCEVIYRFLTAEGGLTGVAGLTSDSAAVAACLYTGLMTDTGNFSFNSTSCDLYEIIADLIRAGAKKDEIYNAVYNQYSKDRVRLTGYALYRKMRIYPEAHLALITLSADELDQFHYQVGDTEGLVNMPLQIADVYYSVYMREERPKPGTPKPRIRISFRSQGDRPVNMWANEVFHGGGHMNASGGELFGSLNQAVQLFEKTYKQYLKSE